MRIWKLEHSEMDYVVFFPKEKWTLDSVYSLLNGCRKAESWVPLPITMDKAHEKFPLNDFPGFDYIPFVVFSQKAATVLWPLIQEDAELLPMIFKGTTYYGINVLSILDCVDYDRSKWKRFKSSGRIMRFESLAFQKDKLQNHHLFRLTEGPRYHYVSDEFRNTVIDNGLTGFAFKLIWEG